MVAVNCGLITQKQTRAAVKDGEDHQGCVCFLFPKRAVLCVVKSFFFVYMQEKYNGDVMERSDHIVDKHRQFDLHGKV